MLNYITKQFKNIFINKAGFVIAWLPYGTVCMYYALGGQGDLNPLFGTSLAIFAKSSMFWTPVLFIFSNKNIMRKITICKPGAETSVLTLGNQKISFFVLNERC